MGVCLTDHTKGNQWHYEIPWSSVPDMRVSLDPIQDRERLAHSDQGNWDPHNCVNMPTESTLMEEIKEQPDQARLDSIKYPTPGKGM